MGQENLNAGLMGYGADAFSDNVVRFVEKKEGIESRPKDCLSKNEQDRLIAGFDKDNLNGDLNHDN